MDLRNAPIWWIQDPRLQGSTGCPHQGDWRWSCSDGIRECSDFTGKKKTYVLGESVIQDAVQIWLFHLFLYCVDPLNNCSMILESKSSSIRSYIESLNPTYSNLVQSNLHNLTCVIQSYTILWSSCVLRDLCDEIHFIQSVQSNLIQSNPNHPSPSSSTSIAYLLGMYIYNKIWNLTGHVSLILILRLFIWIPKALDLTSQRGLPVCPLECFTRTLKCVRMYL